MIATQWDCSEGGPKQRNLAPGTVFFSSRVLFLRPPARRVYYVIIFNSVIHLISLLVEFDMAAVYQEHFFFACYPIITAKIK